MFLVYGYERDVKRRLSLKVPAHVVDDLAHDALVQGDRRGVRRHAPSGSSAAGCTRSSTAPPSTSSGAPSAARRRRSSPASTPARTTSGAPSRAIDSEAGAVELRIIVEEVLETFNEKHRLVIELHVFGGLTAGEVCDRIEGMSEDNVAQIASRFRAKLRARLDPDTGGGP